MELDKSISLQRQVKNNSEDLQKEFLELKNWEKEMKQKDEQLRKESTGQVILPPIRSKKKKEKKVEEQKSESNTETKKIRCHDYAAWDKFDVEKACSEIDKDEKSDESGDEVMPKEEMEKAYEKATKHKNEGNVFVQQKKWCEAIKCYTEAIKLFPYDAIFYANRALCQLKVNNMYSAESDCTTALQLDEEYVKAYYRRATVRVAMKRYNDAKQDLEKALKLEPSNKESKTLLAEVLKEVEGAKPAAPSEKTEKTEKDNKPIEKVIGEKMLGTGTAPKSKEIEKEQLKIEEKKCAETSENKNKYLEIPSWLPEKDDVTVIETISKPPHLRSKKPLRKITIREVESVRQQDNISTTQEKEDVVVNAQINETNKSEETKHEKIIEIPPVPKTFVEFFMNWRKNRDPEFRYKYLLQLHQLPSYSLFEDLIEPDHLSEIIQVLRAEFIKRHEDVYTDLHRLTLIKRFRALIMFFTDKDKENLRVLFNYMADNYENVYGEQISDLRKLYEV